ncbi:MAG: DNA translocase FtsK [Bacilli bacterium]|nr:DNA translocase FtsK [Bacilli bacterium]
MARRRRRSTKSASSILKSLKPSVQVTGIILILIGIIGFGVFGPVGRYIKSFGVFLFGNYYVLFDIIMVILGMFMLFKKDLPNFFTIKMLGIYLLVLSSLGILNINHINQGATLATTFNDFREQFLVTVSDGLFNNISLTGSGVVGLLVSWSLITLLSKTGAIIIFIVLIVVGLVLVFNLDLMNMITYIADSFRKSYQEYKVEREQKKEEDKKRREEEELNNPRVQAYDQEQEEDLYNTKATKVIHSLDELKHNDVEEVEKPVQIVEQVPEISINSNYQLPALNDVLDKIKKKETSQSQEFIKNTTNQLQQVLQDFGITGKVVAIHEGPTVTQFEVAVKNGTRVAAITSISKEIALALAAKDVRIEAPIPGKTTVGVEIPNKTPVGVPIREVIEMKRKDMFGMKLPVSLGKDIMGNNIITDLAKMPHLLVAGSTGSGKSVCVNSMIASLLICKKPDEVRIVLVDPKKVELSNYNGVPHLYYPVVTDPKQASIALQNMVKEMEKRYQMFADNKVKNISGYNEMMAKEIKKNPEDTSLKLMPYILIIIDELADLMLVARKEVEDSIMRITQMARAAGIHLIVATQRPSTDVITGVVKANIPSRIAFAVASQVDSRTILDGSGAEKLLGKGDMLFKPMGENNALRIQGNFISDDEIERVIKYVSSQQPPQYETMVAQEEPEVVSGGGGSTGPKKASDDPLYNEMLKYAVSVGSISASKLQRQFGVGFNRASKIIDEFEADGIVGPQKGSKPREVLIKMEGVTPDSEE